MADSEDRRGPREGPQAEPRGAAQEGDVVGVLLCGGGSRRMGSDKALAPLNGQALIRYPLAALDALCAEVLLACGSAPRYRELGRELVLDARPDGGPLAGLVAGLEAARERGASWVAVLACDMPRAETAVLAALLERARRDGLDACLLGLERGSQPTYAVYHVACAEPARAALAAGRQRLVAFHDGRVAGRPLRVGVLPTDAVALDVQAVRSALNVNTPAELRAEQEACAAGPQGSRRGLG